MWSHHTDKKRRFIQALFKHCSMTIMRGKCPSENLQSVLEQAWGLSIHKVRQLTETLQELHLTVPSLSVRPRGNTCAELLLLNIQATVWIDLLLALPLGLCLQMLIDARVLSCPVVSPIWCKKKVQQQIVRRSVPAVPTSLSCYWV